MLAVLVATILLPTTAMATEEVQSYRDPDDSRGNLDVLRVTSKRVVTASGVAFRTTLYMEDAWDDEDLDVEFFFTELGARWSRCGDDCSGSYYGYMYYDEQERRLRATGFESNNCGCPDLEWRIGRSGSRSVWFDIPEPFLYDGTYAYEIDLETYSVKQEEPLAAPVCLSNCRDQVEHLRFSIDR